MGPAVDISTTFRDWQLATDPSQITNFASALMQNLTDSINQAGEVSSSVCNVNLQVLISMALRLQATNLGRAHHNSRNLLHISAHAKRLIFTIVICWLLAIFVFSEYLSSKSALTSSAVKWTWLDKTIIWVPIAIPFRRFLPSVQRQCSSTTSQTTWQHKSMLDLLRSCLAPSKLYFSRKSERSRYVIFSTYTYILTSDQAAKLSLLKLTLLSPNLAPAPVISAQPTLAMPPSSMMQGPSPSPAASGQATIEIKVIKVFLYNTKNHCTICLSQMLYFVGPFTINPNMRNECIWRVFVRLAWNGSWPELFMHCHS